MDFFVYFSCSAMLLSFFVLMPLGYFLNMLGNYFGEKTISEYTSRTGSEPVPAYKRISDFFKKLFSRTK